MATTRAVLRDTATMVRWLGQRVRTPSPQVQPILQRAQDRLQEMRPLVQRVVDQTRARILGGDTPCPRLLTRGCSQPLRAVTRSRR